MGTKGSTEPEPDDLSSTVEVRSVIRNETIGPYQIVRQLGEGGMGIVYHARQSQPIRRDLALKVIKPGMDSKQVIQRFESERQALALMDHPNIARVFDAGTTQTGHPYFAMELVNGVPINRYCDTKRLTVRQRAELLIPVCRAIQHAHQKGIIHRDIKPSNILVGEVDGAPVPKVIDFGLAKALGQDRSGASVMLTTIGTVVGTFDYMSPEQAETARQDVDTRSDVYSLGAVLYELLTGFTPLDRERTARAGYFELLQQIATQDIERPSQRLRRSSGAEIAERRQTDAGDLPRLLDGELDWIIMKALEKDRTRRYETANGLARDLERYLAGEPVEAAPPSTAYRMRKFLRKHRTWIFTAAAFAVVLIAGIVASSVMTIRARRAEQEAVRQRNVAAAVNEFLQKDLLSQASARRQREPGAKPDPDLRVRTVLERAARTIEGKFATQPALEAAVRLTIGAAYRDLGLNAEAAPQIERAVDLRRRVLGPNHRDTFAALAELGRLYESQGKYAEGEALYSDLVEKERRALGESDGETLSAKFGLARMQYLEGKYDKAEAVARQLLDARERAAQEDIETTAAMVLLAGIETERHKHDEAEALFRKAMDIQRRTLGPEHPDTLKTMNDLSLLYQELKRYGEAEVLQNQAIEVLRRVDGPEHPDTLAAMSNLAVTYSEQHKYAESEAENREILAISRRVLGPEHPSTLITRNNLAFAYKSLGKYKEAAELDAGTLASFQRSLGPTHPNTLASNSNLAYDHFLMGDFGEADRLYRNVYEARRKTLGIKNPSTLGTAYGLALCVYSEGKYREAEELAREQLAVYEAGSPESWMVYRSKSLLGAALAGERRHAEAEPLLVQGAEGLLRHESEIPVRPGMSDVDRAVGWVVRFYRDSGKPAEAAKWEKREAGRRRGGAAR